MPHTTRRKLRRPTKRVEVTDEDGWTRVTTTKSQHREQRARTRAAIVPDPSQTIVEPGATIGKIKNEYQKAKAQWQESESCKVLEEAIANRALQNGISIDKCFMFGSGSFSGLRMGWISRQGVALCQLAVLDTIGDVIQAKSNVRPLLYVQEPAYNDLDVEFLQQSGFAVTQDPSGFDLVDGNSLVYSPCAELNVEVAVLNKMPPVYLTSRLDWIWRNEHSIPCTNRIGNLTGVGDPLSDSSSTDRVEATCQTLERFLRDKASMRMPSLDVKDNPFTDQYLYWQNQSDD